MFRTSDPTLLLQLFNDPKPQLRVTKPIQSNHIDAIRWNLINYLRKSSSHSPLDNFAMSLPTTDTHKVRAYRLATLKLLMSDYVAFGMPALIDAVLFSVRMWLCLICMRSLDLALILWEKGDQPEIGVLGRLLLGIVGLPLWA